MIKVVIADCNVLVRAGLTSILSQVDECCIIGEARSDQELLDMVQAFEVDIVMMDFTEAPFSLDVVPKVIKKIPSCRFIAITDEQPGSIMVGALRAGIFSYIKKVCDVNEIMDSVRETARGGRFFCGKVLETIQRENINIQDLNLNAITCEPVIISERESEIIKLIAEGYTNIEIADRLFLSPHTVNTHRKNIMQKLGVNNTAAIVMYAVKTKLVSPNKFLFSPSLSVT
jgi:DNA-binding NarL/FixJ family response regulator